MGFRQVNKIPWKSLRNAFQISWLKTGKSFLKDKAEERMVLLYPSDIYCEMV